MPDARIASDDFYVGYLPVPPRQRRFLMWLVPLLVAAALGAAAFSTARHADPGAARWDTDHITTIEGAADVAPYAMIREPDPAGGVRTTLLVGEGKHGAIDRIRPCVGQTIRVRGHLLQRDGRQLLELDSDASGVEAISPAAPPPPDVRRVGREMLRGEIIDPKCYFGAMKPGEGKVHRECATLCIAGGIPPMFRTTDQSGRPAYYLIVAADGAAANQLVLPYIGDPVEIDADLEIRGDISVIRLNPAQIKSRR